MTSPSSRRLNRADVDRRDAAVAIVLLGLMVVSIASKAPGAGQRGADLAAYVLAVPLTLPFAVHRRWPIASLICVLAAFGTYAIASYAVYPGISVFAMLFGVAAHSDRRHSVTALVLCVASMVTALAIQPAGVATSSDWTSSLLAVAVAWLAGENQRSRRARWAALKERAAMLENEREERDRRAVADERLRIARDLHDIVSHTMSVIAVQAATGHHLLDRDIEAARRALSNVETASRGALVEMRRMLGVLRDDDDIPGSRAPAPGMAGLGDLLARVRDSGLGVSTTIDDDIPPLPASVDLAAYRIVQESLTNVMKHGGPVAFVNVTCSATELCIEVADNGRAEGTVPTAGDTPGHGVIGMRERVAVYGGDFSAGPRPAGGYRVAARLPLSGSPGIARGRTTAGPVP